MRVGGWNIEGIMKHLPSLGELVSEIEDNVDIMCLSELKCDVANAITADNYFNKYAITPSTSDMYIANRYERIVKTTKNMHNGTAIMLKPDLFKFSKTAEVETPRIVMQKIKNEKVDLLVGLIFMPTNGDATAQQKYEDMASTIKMHVTELRQSSKVILIGDFNIQENHAPQRRQIFKNMVEELGLKVHTPKTYSNCDHKNKYNMLTRNISF